MNTVVAIYTLLGNLPEKLITSTPAPGIVAMLAVVASAVITGLITWHIAQTRVRVENIMQERCKWRDKIRTLAEQAQLAIMNQDNAEIVRLRTAFKLSLNPTDPEDVAIWQLVDSSAFAVKDRRERVEEFSDRVSLLLKHDWERAKYKAGEILDMPVRMSYTDFITRRSRGSGR